MERLVIWRITDGKAGHEAQTEGLIRALAGLRELSAHDLPAPSRCGSVLNRLAGTFPSGRGLPSPDLVVAAGHATHFALLAAKRARGGLAVVLMKPTLPLAWFDLCLIPVHDGPPERPNVIATTGVLNPVVAAPAASTGRGLILVGGPSAHYEWDGADLTGQVERVCGAEPDVDWVLTTSRRTPPDTTAALEALALPNLDVVPVERTERGWVARHLQECALAWVTEDSVSMVFEALTAGAGVGLLRVPAGRGASRVRDAVERLVAEGRVTRFDPSAARYRPERSAEPLAEAERCARLVLERVTESRR